jgi:hypothetical protein
MIHCYPKSQLLTTFAHMTTLTLIFFFLDMIIYHLNIQLFTTLSICQGGPPLVLEFFFFFKKNKIK